MLRPLCWFCWLPNVVQEIKPWRFYVCAFTYALRPMTNSRFPAWRVAFTLVLVVCSRTHAQKTANTSQRLLSLNFKNNGQHLTAGVGQQIEITLGTVGPPQYGKPKISSPAMKMLHKSSIGTGREFRRTNRHFPFFV